LWEKLKKSRTSPPPSLDEYINSLFYENKPDKLDTEGSITGKEDARSS
jgi:hypothetical protein